ncbi:MAG TPA: hypothetical protein VMW63_04800 [Methanoregulaceae archaeon]|nr:hypothetical protein [Methanoregulaceae archaeon]
MLEYWVVVTIGVVVVVCAICAAYLYSESKELKVLRNRYRLKVYEELFHAITELNIAGTDSYKLDRAKQHLAYTLNRMNLVASQDVLKNVNALLDFLNETPEGEYDILKQLNILNNLVKSIRKEIDPATTGALEDGQFRFRFYSPPRS